MSRHILCAALLATAVPAVAKPADEAPPLAAGLDRDMLCQLLVTHTATQAEKLPDDRRTDVARMLMSLEHSESFFIGVIVARMSDAQITKAADVANTALVAATDDQRAAHLTWCLNDATIRSRHYFDRTAAH